MEFGAERLSSALTAIDPAWSAAEFCVAFSGGLDSTVLLHAMAELAHGRQLRLRAVHVDHGLQPQSAAWAESCRAASRSAGVPIDVLTLDLVPAAGDSVEAAARYARYGALARQLKPGEWLLTAHHRDDQLETVLIQLLRGAGVAGLAAMPELARLGAGWHARPLLGLDRSAIAAYAGQQGLDWVRDPMNDSTRFDRGWLRERVLPAIRERWPAASATVARSASHLGEARRLLDELAQADAVGIVAGHGTPDLLRHHCRAHYRSGSAVLRRPAGQGRVGSAAGSATDAVRASQPRGHRCLLRRRPRRRSLPGNDQGCLQAMNPLVGGGETPEERPSIVSPSSPRGFSIQVGVGRTDCLAPDGQPYDAQVLIGMPAVADQMEAIARQAGYESRLRLVSPPDRSGNAASLATKENFLSALAGCLAKIQAGDHLLITFAGHGERRWQNGDPDPESGWVFQDDHLYAIDLADHLNRGPAGTRILLISESCYSGSLIANAPDFRKRLVGDRYRPTVIQIGASYSYERAHVVNGVPVFTASLLDVWDGGHFTGFHEKFAADILKRMADRIGAVASGQIYQELRYLVTGRDRDEMTSFEELTPFWVGGHRRTTE